ncbi:MAG: SoxR reducing system RseC family protein [Candidatus Omnitrophica bacterium]|nr:SoxR reducing system RseC family protein [Candidatus Omnitrophota bacterium]
MLERATVIHLDDDALATVTFERNSACGRCGLCDSAGDNTMTAQVRNTIGARVGDSVYIEIDPSAFVRATTFLYAIPLAVLLGGLVLGNAAGILAGIEETGRISLSVFTGIACTILALVVVSKYMLQSKERFLPKIARIG